MILDRTLNINYQKQRTVILKYMNVSSSLVWLEESILGFLDVNDTLMFNKMDYFCLNR